MQTAVRVVSLEAIPSDSSASGASASGAYVNVYLIAEADEYAIGQAQREVEEAGWVVTGEASVATVDEHSFDAGSDGLSYYEQCPIDGVVVVLHTWRHEH